MNSTEPPESDRFLRDLVDTGAGLCSLADGLVALEAGPQARARVLDDLRPYDRLARFEAAVAALLQLPRADAAAALRRIDDPAAWLPQAPGVSYLPVASGPNAGFFLAGFLRVEAGMEFPEHEHLGEEITLVLQGAFEESNSGVLFRPGEPSYMPPGSRHTFRVPADGPHLVGLATVKRGLRLVPNP